MEPAETRSFYQESAELRLQQYQAEINRQNTHALAASYQKLVEVAEDLEDSAFKRLMSEKQLALFKRLCDEEYSVQNTRDLAISYWKISAVNGGHDRQFNAAQSYALFKALQTSEKISDDDEEYLSDLKEQKHSLAFQRISAHTRGIIQKVTADKPVIRLSRRPRWLQWGAVPEDLRLSLIEQINRDPGKGWYEQEQAEMKMTVLPFYQEGRLIEMKVPGREEKQEPIFFFYYRNRIEILNGESGMIHQINEQLELEITEDLAADYLRFFCLFVHGEEGPFYIIEEEEMKTLNEGIIDPDILHSIEAVWNPLEVKPESDSFMVTGTVLYGMDLFKCTFEVKKNGEIEMMDDQTLASHISSVFI